MKLADGQSLLQKTFARAASIGKNIGQLDFSAEIFDQVPEDSIGRETRARQRRDARHEELLRANASPGRHGGRAGPVVIEPPDALLVASRNRAQDAKQLFSRLKASGHESHKLHRLTNRGTADLVLIEVQSGNYLSEDGIVRFDDQYGRA